MTSVLEDVLIEVQNIGASLRALKWATDDLTDRVGKSSTRDSVRPNPPDVGEGFNPRAEYWLKFRGDNA